MKGAQTSGSFEAICKTIVDVCFGRSFSQASSGLEDAAGQPCTCKASSQCIELVMFKRFNFMQFLSQAQALVFSSGSGTPDYSTKQQRRSDSKIGKQSFEGFSVLTT